jgi:hypothetical protein
VLAIFLAVHTAGLARAEPAPPAPTVTPTTPTPPTVAVLGIEAIDVPEEVAALATAAVRAALSHRTDLVHMPGKDLVEMRFLFGCTDERQLGTCLGQAGRLLSVDKVVFGTLRPAAAGEDKTGDYFVRLRVLDVASETVSPVEVHEAATPEQDAPPLLEDSAAHWMAVLLAGAAGLWYAAAPTSPGSSSAGNDTIVGDETIARRADEAFWQAVKDSSDPVVLKGYLDRHPGGQFAAEARTRIATLERQASEQKRQAEAKEAERKHAEEQRIAAAKADAERAEQARKQAVAAAEADLRRAEEARLAALAAAEAERKRAEEERLAAARREDDAFWLAVKDSTDPAVVRSYGERFSAGTHLQEAQQALATLEKRLTEEARAAVAAREDERKRADEALRQASLKAEAAGRLAALQTDPKELARLLQFELKRVGCFAGTVNGEINAQSRDAIGEFAKQAKLALDTTEPSLDLIKAVRSFDKRVCPLVCRSGERPDGDQCVKITCGPGQELKNGNCVEKPAAEAKRPSGSGTARSGGNCFSFNGKTYCQ